MGQIDVRIEKLEASPVAFTTAFSRTPEKDALGKLAKWAKPKGLLDDREKHTCFGFNDPCPEDEDTEYEYEVWLTVGQDIKPDGEIDVKSFDGGLYAVVTARSIEEISSTWKKLAKWRKESGYSPGVHRELERHISMPGIPGTEDFRIDLMLPISE